MASHTKYTRALTLENLDFFFLAGGEKDMNEDDMSKLRLYCPFMSKALDKAAKATGLKKVLLFALLFSVFL